MRWYAYKINEVWIVEKLNNGYYSYFEIRKYKYDGRIEKEILGYFDGVTTININQMQKLELVSFGG